MIEEMDANKHSVILTLFLHVPTNGKLQLRFYYIPREKGLAIIQHIIQTMKQLKLQVEISSHLKPILQNPVPEEGASSKPD